MQPTTLILMHFLGGSTREWDEVLPLLNGQPTLALDMPGFGAAHDETGYTVSDMADYVEAAIARSVTGAYVLVGHSMSGKVAAVVASREAARPAKTGLAGLVLIAPSPTNPEPMDDTKRHGMIALLGEHNPDDRTRARKYITKNQSRDLSDAVLERAITETLNMNRTAWVAWLTHGSKEDWAERVGVLTLPALVVAGGADTSLGEEVQRRDTMPHLAHGRIVTLKGCSHLVPMERPAELAALLLGFIQEIEMPQIPQEYLDFIASDRVSEPTRKVLETRIAGPVYPADLFTARQAQTLRAVLDRVIPQQPGAAIDLATTIMAKLATGKGDGWRYDVLPPDAEAYRRGLDKLADDGFVAMSAEKQDHALEKLQSHKGTPGAYWFEEVRGAATDAYVSHPATYARIGYSGIGVGGANTPNKGFITLAPNQRESWEPVPAAEQS